MAPAFSSTRQAGAFAAVLLILLTLPAIVGKSMLPPRSEAYASLTWRYCSDFIYRQIFKEKSDIDIAFVGSSRMWAGIDTPYVQKALSEKLGREAVVVTTAWSWLGFDANYFVTQDLLRNRKVRMIVFDDEYRADDVPHVAATHWFRFGENAGELEGLPLRIQMSYYFAAVLGMPRNLLSMVRQNKPEVVANADDAHWANFFHAQNARERLGALTVDRWLQADRPFAEFIPHNNVQGADVSIYSPQAQSQFRFAGPPTSQWQLEFAKRFATLAKDHGTKLVFLHLCPVYSSNETTNPYIEEREDWSKILGDVPMVGIPPAKLYSGIDPDDLPKFFYTPDLCHYNRNGERYFTRIITPTLIQLYENSASH
jgi:hypothetical protein